MFLLLFKILFTPSQLLYNVFVPQIPPLLLIFQKRPSTESDWCGHNVKLPTNAGLVGLGT